MDDQVPQTVSTEETPARKFWEQTKGGVPSAVAQTIVGGIFAILVIAGTAYKDEVVAWLHAKHNNSPQVLQNAATRDREVYNTLVELRTLFKADRALIRQFHNGDYWSNGSPIRKISTSYETDRLGVSSVFETVRNISLTQVPDLLDHLMKYREPRFVRVDDLPPGGYKDLLRVQGVECFISVPLYLTGAKQQLIGELKLHWLNDTPTPADMAAIEHAVSRIEFLLSRDK